MLKINEAQIDDSKAIYDIRTSPEISKVSYLSESFTFETHQAWFATALNNPLRRIYAIRDAQDTIVGVVRFDLNEAQTEATVSIYVSPKKWGQGIGSFALIEGEKRIKNECSTIKKLIASVLVDNKASINIFDKCSYITKMVQMEKMLE